ncbi:hypothetical protein DCS32_08470 [Dokdonia sp. Dokd-P16]|uniref:hypothetical protein n=1 Tax=Dokdonia sp. Dokd-P16 TaxID=2173169 RepID=UPI000D54976D|nr:hypothetical protein [Dokdonia sp. Dokd-P16]AWH74194.1 hypothetical protein DCS32_08470 [Dokdonia sp. Dokd-P16]
MKLPIPEHAINRFALKLAAFSACLGILFVIVFFVTGSTQIAIIGIYHLIPTLPVHLIVLVCVLFSAVTHRNELPEHFLTLIIMLLNIPLAFACGAIVLNSL